MEWRSSLQRFNRDSSRNQPTASRPRRPRRGCRRNFFARPQRKILKLSECRECQGHVAFLRGLIKIEEREK